MKKIRDLADTGTSVFKCVAAFACAFGEVFNACTSFENYSSVRSRNKSSRENFNKNNNSKKETEIIFSKNSKVNKENEKK